MEYANIKTGREYAFVSGSDVVVAACTGKRCGVILLGDTPVGEQNVYPKTQADALREKIAAQKAAELTPEPTKTKKARSRSADSKASKADTIYVQMVAEGKNRKDIICEFMTRLKISYACSSTYYQNAKKRNI